MSLQLDYKKSKRVCNVTFTLPKEVAGNTKKVHLVSDFNQWSQTATPMKRAKNGSFSVSVDLPVGKQYQFRYLLDGIHWENDNDADKHVPTVFGNAQNSVVIV
jgi:1,4-alpha-glucan branching enzyme